MESQYSKLKPTPLAQVIQTGWSMVTAHREEPSTLIGCHLHSLKTPLPLCTAALDNVTVTVEVFVSLPCGPGTQTLRLLCRGGACPGLITMDFDWQEVG